jgi:hypothetical protein
MPSALETADLYEAGFLLATGAARLASIRVQDNGHVTGWFLLEGPDVIARAGALRNGHDLVSLAALRVQLNRLRDLLFARLREHEKEGRKCLRVLRRPSD